MMGWMVDVEAGFWGGENVGTPGISGICRHARFGPPASFPKTGQTTRLRLLAQSAGWLLNTSDRSPAHPRFFAGGQNVFI